MELTTLLIATVVSLIAYVWFTRPDPHFPPSPKRPLPLLGHLFYMSRDYRTQFREWRKQCGDIFSLKMCTTPVVVLNGFDVIKEALVKKADAFTDRPPFFMDEVIGTSQKGIGFANGENWKEQRSVALSILRAFGMGKNLLAEKIQEEVKCYVECLASYKGKPTNIRDITNISMSNIICSILMGHRFEYNDTHFQDLIHKLEIVANDQGNVSLINFMFWLKHIPGDFFMAKKITRSMTALKEMISKFIAEKRRYEDDPNDIRNFIDAYILEKNRKIQAGIPTLQDDKNLTKIMIDLFGAGTETTSTTIYWCVLYMLNYPDVQEKVYREIKDKVGKDRTPTIQDKGKLIYLNAVIMETQRLASIVPLAVTHMVSEDVTLKDYMLPKGTHIIPNLDSALHDEATWGDDALSFRPERFIDDNGKLKNPEQFIPFGIGRRVCLGEALAKMELFLFLANMAHKFEFLPAIPGSMPPLDCECGFVVVPRPYEVRALERI